MGAPGDDRQPARRDGSPPDGDRPPPDRDGSRAGGRHRGLDRRDQPSLAWLGSDPDLARPLAVIWATVELERALADLASGTDAVADQASGEGSVSANAGSAAAEDPLLGARVVVVPSAGDEPAIALAEPSTEGRLAGTLARHGEGPAGRYVLARADLEAIRLRAAAANVAISRPELGPFGLEVLVLGPVGGPHLILVDPAAVPSRP